MHICYLLLQYVCNRLIKCSNSRWMDFGEKKSGKSKPCRNRKGGIPQLRGASAALPIHACRFLGALPEIVADASKPDVPLPSNQKPREFVVYAPGNDAISMFPAQRLFQKDPTSNPNLLSRDVREKNRIKFGAIQIIS